LATTAGAVQAVDLDQPVGTEFDVVFEVSGTSSGMRSALSAVHTGGRLVVVGLQHDQPPPLIGATISEIELIGTNALVLASDLPDAPTCWAGSPGYDRKLPPVSSR
jgi:threonine dehydrogenase-like Zn-dependent dehydrogenase